MLIVSAYSPLLWQPTPPLHTVSKHSSLLLRSSKMCLFFPRLKTFSLFLLGWLYTPHYASRTFPDRSFFHHFLMSDSVSFLWYFSKCPVNLSLGEPGQGRAGSSHERTLEMVPLSSPLSDWWESWDTGRKLVQADTPVSQSCALSITLATPRAQSIFSVRVFEELRFWAIYQVELLGLNS